MTDQVLPASRVDRLDPLNQTGTSNPDQTFFSIVSAASWSHSTAATVAKPAASIPRSNPPAPENNEMAEPTVTPAVCTAGPLRSRTPPPARRLSWTPPVR